MEEDADEDLTDIENLYALNKQRFEETEALLFAFRRLIHVLDEILPAVRTLLVDDLEEQIARLERLAESNPDSFEAPDWESHPLCRLAVELRLKSR